MHPSFSLFLFLLSIAVAIFVSQSFCFLAVLWCHSLLLSPFCQLVCNFTFYWFLNFLVSEILSDLPSLILCFPLLCSVCFPLVFSIAHLNQLVSLTFVKQDFIRDTEIFSSISISSRGFVGDFKITDNSRVEFEKSLPIHTYHTA